MLGSQHDDPARNARQLPSGVILGWGWGESEVIFEPCTNAGLPQTPPRSLATIRTQGSVPVVTAPGPG